MRPNTDMKTARLLTAVLLGAVLLANIIGCSHSTKPKEVKYNLYVGATHLYASPEDSSFNRIYIYDADSLTLLDSVSVANFPGYLGVTPDGRWLYVTTLKSWREFALWKIDVRTKQVAWRRSDIGGKPQFLDRGRLLLIGRDLLRPQDGALVGHFSDSLYLGWGPSSGTRVAAVIRSALTEPDYDSIIRVFDVATGELSGKYVPRLSNGIVLDAGYTRLHPDGKRVMAIGLYGNVHYSWFVVGDVETGQTLFEYRISNQGGEIAISSDGNLAAFTDPGIAAFGENGTPYVIDLRTLRVTTPPLSTIVHAAHVRFLPGDRRIVTSPASDLGFFDAGPLDILDISTLNLEKRIWPTGFDSLNAPSVSEVEIAPRP